jgi:hypothetical protein
VVDLSVRRAERERVIVPALCALAAASIVIAAWRLLGRATTDAGVATVVAGVALVAAGLVLRPTDRTSRVLLSFTDRAFDGVLLATLAWVSRTPEPSVAAAAVVALAAGFLASYIRARGGSLGYGIEEGIVTPVMRYALLALALLLDGTGWAVWAIAGVNVLAAAVRSSQVAKEERL